MTSGPGNYYNRNGTEFHAQDGAARQLYARPRDPVYFPESGALDYNNMQAASLFVEKYNEWWGLLAGLKVPFRYGMTADPQDNRHVG